MNLNKIENENENGNEQAVSLLLPKLLNLGSFDGQYYKVMVLKQKLT